MIEVKNLVKCYGNHIAVNDLSFTVETGKVVGFLGPNGAGKSTTMNMITGYIAPTSGTVLIDGIDILEEPEKAKEKIGYLPEIPPLYQDLRVREYLQFVAELKKVAKKDRDLAVFQVMKKTKTEEVSESLIRHLSKGYKQRVGLAAAMLGQPDILILDEPTVGLDPGQIIEIRELIRELSEEHTVLLSSHIMQEISAVCDEIIVINEGQMIACDTPENFTRQMSQSNGVYIQVKGEREQIIPIIEEMSDVEHITEEESEEENTVVMTVYAKQDIREDIFFTMAELSCPILEMRSIHGTLEEAFLALTEGTMEKISDDMTTRNINEQEDAVEEKRMHLVLDEKEILEQDLPEENQKRGVE